MAWFFDPLPSCRFEKRRARWQLSPERSLASVTSYSFRLFVHSRISPHILSGFSSLGLRSMLALPTATRHPQAPGLLEPLVSIQDQLWGRRSHQASASVWISRLTLRSDIFYPLHFSHWKTFKFSNLVCFPAVTRLTSCPFACSGGHISCSIRRLH